MKSRPTWADELSEWKALTRAWCKSGKLSLVERFSYEFIGLGQQSVRTLPPRSQQPVYVLFDYTRRNALDRQAYCRYITEVEQE